MGGEADVVAVEEGVRCLVSGHRVSDDEYGSGA